MEEQKTRGFFSWLKSFFTRSKKAPKVEAQAETAPENVETGNNEEAPLEDALVEETQNEELPVEDQPADEAVGNVFEILAFLLN